MKNIFSFIAVVILGGVMQAESEYQNNYFVYDGSVATRIEGDAAQTNYKQWRVWLFKKNAMAANRPEGSWGTISGNSAADVMKKLKASQEFEKQYERWCACTWGQDTFFNSVGPIAITEFMYELKTVHQLKEASDAYEQVTALMDNAERIFDQIKGLQITDSGIREYANHIKAAVEKIDRLSNLFNNTWFPSVERINHGLDDIKNDLEITHTWEASLRRVGFPSTVKSTVPKQILSSQWTDQKLGYKEQIISIQSDMVRVTVISAGNTENKIVALEDIRGVGIYPSAPNKYGLKLEIYKSDTRVDNPSPGVYIGHLHGSQHIYLDFSSAEFRDQAQKALSAAAGLAIE
jgi:hypothetical protein